MIRRAILAAAILLPVASETSAQAQVPAPATLAAPDTSPVRTFGGFVDTYYAWDFNRPAHFDRAYTTQHHVTPKAAIVGRVEQYSDPSQIIVVTGLPASFQTTGGSLGLDVNLQAPVLWRTELRGFRSKESVWPQHTAGYFGRSNAFLVSSLALTF